MQLVSHTGFCSSSPVVSSNVSFLGSATDVVSLKYGK
ncbi:hypothetical protein T10_1482 [Trichinella papuae]|uniref:Uncharacterized protein n=1 Tax=Trichinella papuae TaxID=268474 RepID=A0A0V1LYQ1_9BILA|nr:hypothetical protein T10_1482 [Trichinella papuae]